MSDTATALLAEMQRALPPSRREHKTVTVDFDLYQRIAAYLAKPLPEEVATIIAELNSIRGYSDTAERAKRAADLLDRLGRLSRAGQDAEARIAELKRRLTVMRDDARIEFGLGLMPWLLEEGKASDTACQLANILSGWHEAKQASKDAEAEIARLRQEADEAIMLAEGPSTLKEIAAGFVARGMENARLREALLLGLQLTDSGGHDGKSENCPTCHFANEARKALAEPKP